MTYAIPVLTYISEFNMNCLFISKTVHCDSLEDMICIPELNKCIQTMKFISVKAMSDI